MTAGSTSVLRRRPDDLCAFHIQSRAGLVQQENFWVGCQRTGDAKPLLLAARELQSALVQFILHFLPKTCDLQILPDNAVQLCLFTGSVVQWGIAWGSTMRRMV